MAWVRKTPASQRHGGRQAQQRAEGGDSRAAGCCRPVAIPASGRFRAPSPAAASRGGRHHHITSSTTMPARPAGFVQDVIPWAGSGRAAKFPAITASPGGHRGDRPQQPVHRDGPQHRVIGRVEGLQLAAAGDQPQHQPRPAGQHQQGAAEPAGHFRPGDAAVTAAAVVAVAVGAVAGPGGATAANPGRVAVRAMAAAAVRKMAAVVRASLRGRKSRMRRTDSTACRRIRRGPG